MTELPRRWHATTLGDVAAFVRGVTYKKQEARSQAEQGCVPLLRATNVGLDLNLHEGILFVPAVRVSAAQMLRPGDIVVVASSGSAAVVGKSAQLVVHWTGTFGAFLTVVRPGPDVDARFLFLLAQSSTYRQRWSDAARGTNINNLKVGNLRATPVPVPPLDEQRRIVEILEDHLSRLDAADAYLEASQRRITALRLSALSHARRSLVDEGVGLRRLGEIASTTLGKMLDAKKATGTPTPYLRNINVRWGAFDISDLNEVQLTDSERARLELRKGDLMVCEGGEPGRCAVWPGGGFLVAYQKALHRLRVLDEAHVDVAFVGLMLEESIRAGRADRMFTGTTIKHLPQEKLRMMEIPVPGPGRQREVVADLSDLESASVHARSECEAARARGRALRRALLHAAFTGRLTGRDRDADVLGDLEDLSRVAQLSQG